MGTIIRRMTMEKYGREVLRDIIAELQLEPETWRYDAEVKILRYETYVNRLQKRFKIVA